MKALIIALLVLLANCGTTHKVVTSTKRTTDSTATTSRDTAHVSQQAESSSNLTAKDVHVRIEFSEPAPDAGQSKSFPPDNPRPSPAKPRKTGNKIVDAIQDAVAGAGSAGQLPSSITIDIGSLQDSSSTASRKDSGAGHATTAAAVHKDEQSASKDVRRWFLPIWGWALILLIILAVVYRYRANIIAFVIKNLPK